MERNSELADYRAAVDYLDPTAEVVASSLVMTVHSVSIARAASAAARADRTVACG